MSRTLNGNLTGAAARMQRQDFQASPTPQRSIEDELLSSLEFLQNAKTREMKWTQTRKDSKSACMFCKLAVNFHKQELSVRDQILLVASMNSMTFSGGEIIDRSPISQEIIF